MTRIPRWPLAACFPVACLLAGCSGGGKADSASVLTEQDIAALRTEWADPKGERRFVFTAAFGPGPSSPARSGRYPFRITADAREVKESRGRTLSERLTESVAIVVTDSAGQVVARRSVPLDRMCPS